MLHIERFYSDGTKVLQDSESFLVGHKKRVFEPFIKGDNVLEVQNIKAIQKGSLLAICDVRIVPWKLTLKEVKIFEKGVNRWIGLPSKEVALPTGEKKYYELMAFDSEEIKNRFRDQIMEAVDTFLEKNPDMKPEDVIKFDDDLPF